MFLQEKRKATHFIENVKAFTCLMQIQLNKPGGFVEVKSLRKIDIAIYI